MFRNGGAAGPLAALLLFVGPVQAEETEPTAIVEIGGAGDWGLGGGSSFGPSAAVEFTPIKGWLEIEAGVAPLFCGGNTEWDTAFCSKSLSPCPIPLSLWSVLDRNGCSRERGPNLPVRPRSILCSGRCQSENSVGSWNRATATLSAAGTNNRSA